jgi:cardiolipin synthase
MPYVRGHVRGGHWIRPRYRYRRQTVVGWAAAMLSVPLLLGAGAALRHVGPKAEPTPTQAGRYAGPAAASGDLTLYTEPDAGLGPVYRLITGARRTLRMAMYELRDQVAEQDLAAAAARGVDVRVLLDQNRERSRNTAAFAFLSAHGVHVAWADPSYATTHEKAITADRTVAAITTLNLVSADYPSTRDLLVVDRNKADVAAIDATFAADYAHRDVVPGAGADLVWSPTTSQSALLAVTLVLTTDPRWASTLVQLQAAGANVVELDDASSDLDIHAKVIAADPGTPTARAIVGSQNFSVASLRYNRELGVLLRDRRLVGAAAAVIRADAHVGPTS